MTKSAIYGVPTFLSALLFSVLIACTHEMPPTTDLDTFCQNAFPVYLAGDEHLDDLNADKLMAMDKYGIKHCGWEGYAHAPR